MSEPYAQADVHDGPGYNRDWDGAQYPGMAEALARQADARSRSQAVDRRGWTRAQWVEDAHRLMDEVDGAVTSLVNGHVIALLDTATAHDACSETAGLRERLEALHRPIDAVQPCAHSREGEHCGVEVDGVWTATETCGGGDRHGHGVLRVQGCSECMVGSYGCDMPDGLDAWDATVLVEATGWCHVPWPCPTIRHVRSGS